jgi:hypothetical protein
MTRVLTVLNHGTDSNTLSAPDEIINRLEQAFRSATLGFGKNTHVPTTLSGKIAKPLGLGASGHDATPTRELDVESSFLVTQGQGTRGEFSPNRASVSVTPAPGYFGESQRELRRQELERAEKQSDKNVFGRLGGKGFGLMKGGGAVPELSDSGVFANVQRLYNHLERCKAAGKPIERLNLVGWSRGAVTCLRQANFLFHNGYADLEVNIFGVDPVAGLGQDDDEGEYPTNTFFRNVNNYVFGYAAHEDRIALPPLPLPINPPKNYIMLPLPGDHTDLAYGGNKNASGRLLAHLCYKFLNQHGSFQVAERVGINLKSSMFLSIDAQLAEYEKLIKSLGEAKSSYAAIRNSANIHLSHPATRPLVGMLTYSAGDTGRNLNPFDRHFFLNDHHKMIFKEKFASIYNTLCDQAGTNVALQDEFLRDHLAVLNSLPEHAKRIRAMLMHKSRQDIRDIMNDTSPRRAQDIEFARGVENLITSNGLCS